MHSSGTKSNSSIYLTTLAMSSMTEQEFYESFPDYEDFAPFLDENDEINFQAPTFIPDFSSFIIVDGIPIIGAEKKDKLCGVILKLYSKIYPGIVMEDINMPFDETNNSYGFCMIRLGSKEYADTAIAHTNGFKMDPKHTLKVNAYADLDKYALLPNEFVPPETDAFKPRPDPTSWLSDPQCRDQFVVRYSNETEICWATTVPNEVPPVDYGGEREKEGGKVIMFLVVHEYKYSGPLISYCLYIYRCGVNVW
jgi:RNA recognition motif-containing protein